MDVNGAKALKRRLEENGGTVPPRVSAPVPADAPPVYHWFGVGKPSSELSAGTVEEAPRVWRSWLRRLRGDSSPTSHA